MLSVVVIAPLFWRESDSAKDFACLRGANGDKLAEAIVAIVISITCGQSGGADAVGDLYQLIRVGARVAIRADSGSDGIDGDGAIMIVPAGDVAAAACGWID